jgi:hydroxymethylglutaryl-CoA lyase
MVNTTLRDVTLRDGAQSLPCVIPPSLKRELVSGIVEAGVRYVELGSFVGVQTPIYLKLADTPTLLKDVPQRDGVEYCARAPSWRQYRSARGAGFKHVAAMVSANAEHQLANTDGFVSIDKAVGYIHRMRDHSSETDGRLTLYVVTSFGHDSLSDTPVDQLVSVVERLVEGGVGPYDCITLGDTFSKATVRSVYERVAAVRSVAPGVPLALHYHCKDQMRWGDLVLAGIDAGVTQFDGTLGGIGGCPTKDSPQGNLSLAHLADFLKQHGHPTGLDVQNLYRLTETFRDGLIPR